MVSFDVILTVKFPDCSDLVEQSHNQLHDLQIQTCMLLKLFCCE